LILLCAQIPLNIAIRETSDAGAPIVASQPDSAAAAAYVSVAERVWAKLQELDRRKEAEKRGPPRVVVE
jgi:ATP-binding protein involved in chromosome partitioning